MSNAAAISTMMMASVDHLTPEERERLTSRTMIGCLVQDGASALALIHNTGRLLQHTPEPGYSPNRWLVEQYARREGCTWVLWEPEGYVLDGFSTPSAPKGDAP